jgi:hypothetical protein
VLPEAQAERVQSGGPEVNLEKAREGPNPPLAAGRNIIHLLALIWVEADPDVRANMLLKALFKFSLETSRMKDSLYA